MNLKRDLVLADLFKNQNVNVIKFISYLKEQIGSYRRLKGQKLPVEIGEYDYFDRNDFLNQAELLIRLLEEDTIVHLSEDRYNLVETLQFYGLPIELFIENLTIQLAADHAALRMKKSIINDEEYFNRIDCLIQPELVILLLLNNLQKL